MRVAQMVYLLIKTSFPDDVDDDDVANLLLGCKKASLMSDGEYFSRYCRKLLVTCCISGIFTT